MYFVVPGSMENNCTVATIMIATCPQHRFFSRLFIKFYNAITCSTLWMCLSDDPTYQVELIGRVGIFR